MKKKILFAIFILILAALPRSIELLSHNYLFGFDQGLFFEEVRKMVVNRKPTLIGAEVGGGGFFQGPGWYYLLTIPFLLSGGDPYAAMVMMFVIGLSVVLIAFVLGNKMFGLTTGVFIAVLIAISPAIISQSRFIWPPFPISLLSVLCIFFIYKVLNKSQKFLPILTFTVGLMSHFEIATAGSLLIQLLIFSPVLLIKKLVSARIILLSIATFIFTQLTLIIFDLRHQFIISKGVFRLLSGGNSDHQVTLKYVEAMFFNHLDVFRFNFFSTFQVSSMLWIPILLILILGSIVYIKDRKHDFPKRALVFYLITSPIFLFVVFMLFLKPMWEWWILELQIYYCFLLGILFGYFWKNIVLRLLTVGLLLVFLISFINQTITFFKTDLYDFGGVFKIKGKIEAIDYVYKDAKNDKFGLLIYNPPVYTYDYDYLIWWYGNRKYNYIPHKQKKGTFYLLIEPDMGKPWTYKGWLETVIKIGQVVNTKHLPSGFIIQKRIEK